MTAQPPPAPDAPAAMVTGQTSTQAAAAVLPAPVGHSVTEPGDVRDIRGFGNAGSVMSGSSTKASAWLRAARVGLSLRGVSAGDSPRRTPRTRSLCSYPRDKACNETTRASRQLVCTDACACPGRSMAKTRTVGSPRERRVWVCPVPSRCSRDGQARALPSRPMRGRGQGCPRRGRAGMRPQGT